MFSQMKGSVPLSLEGTGRFSLFRPSAMTGETILKGGTLALDFNRWADSTTPSKLLLPDTTLTIDGYSTIELNPHIARSQSTASATLTAGSVGFAVAWSAAKLGSDVILIEKEGMLGGTSTTGGISNWEPVAGATGVPYRVYRQLDKIPGAAGVYEFDRHCMWKRKDEAYKFPGGMLKTDPTLPYWKTLLRHGHGMGNQAWFRENCHGVIFEPDNMACVMMNMLRETERCRVLLNTQFVNADHENGKVTALHLADGRVGGGVSHAYLRQ